MTFLFRDNTRVTEWFKINSETKEEALLIALKNMLSDAAIDVDYICESLELELIDPNDLEEYE